ncbi:hypothetical protein FKX85_06665 [Echinicola soli]|uniref:Uncharacterized protein n=1 Tax=Echinicola soli TaxID=2591634 RepID=A0A514CGF1_9BACT|nr:hypothetical protein [Echinicola soli]QDH78734.1 hypothetical protein FKX85_06665 [Echinicola soli]
MTRLSKYITAFHRIKQGSTKIGPAPHKSVFLLTLIDLIERGMITQNQFLVDADLVATFQSIW